MLGLIVGKDFRQLKVINKHDLLMTFDFSVSFSLASVMMGLLLI